MDREYKHSLISRRFIATLCALLMLAALFTLAACSRNVTSYDGWTVEDAADALETEERALCAYLSGGNVKKLQGGNAVILARRELNGGALLLAELIGDDSSAPELYYVDKSAVICATSASSPDHINYTRLFGDTVVYGRSFALDAKGAPLNSTSIEAHFTSGEAVRTDLVCKDGAMRGFILLGEGGTWLRQLSIYNGDTLIADDANASLARTGDVYSNEPVSIRSCTQFNYMSSAKAPDERAELIVKSNVRAGDNTTVLTTWADSFNNSYKLAFADMWRSANSLASEISASVGEKLLVSGVEHEDIMGIYWVDLNKDDGSVSDSEAVKQAAWAHIGLNIGFPDRAQKAWSAPEEAGDYMVIFRTPKAYYSAVVRVV